jgi:hypothetical protein
MPPRYRAASRCDAVPVQSSNRNEAALLRRRSVFDELTITHFVT